MNSDPREWLVKNAHSTPSQVRRIIHCIEEMNAMNAKADSYIRLLGTFPEYRVLIMASIPVKLRAEVELFYEL